jgi:hypothetical protein
MKYIYLPLLGFPMEEIEMEFNGGIGKGLGIGLGIVPLPGTKGMPGLYTD